MDEFLDPSRRPVARIVLDLFDDGALSVSGNVGDKKLATDMLDAARAAVDGKLRKSRLIVPYADVQAVPDERNFPLGEVVKA